MRSRHFVLVLGLVAACLGAGSAQADPPTLPNLAAIAPSAIYIGAADDPAAGYPFALRFTTDIANRGAYPFEVLASPNDPTYLDEQPAVAQQCITWVGHLCQARVPTGTFGWSTSHGHFHVDAMARYELRRMSPDGETPDWSDAGLVQRHDKISFCMEDTNIDVTWRAGITSTPMYVYCDAVLQGISSGWYDEYGAGLAGQSFGLNGIADGLYAIVITVNPDGVFLETTSRDNTVWKRILLSDHATNVSPI